MKAFIFCCWLITWAFSGEATFSQTNINAQTESAYQQAVKRVQTPTRQWLNTTKATWLKAPDINALRNIISKKFPQYNPLERENLALVLVTEAIRESEKDHHDLKTQQQSFANDETKLMIIKSRLATQPEIASGTYFQAARTIMDKYPASQKPVVDSARASAGQQPADSIKVLLGNIENTLEEIHNRRQSAESNFQPADQRMTRLNQALASVNKMMSELKNLSVRNYL